jgi:hypothetical protein
VVPKPPHVEKYYGDAARARLHERGLTHLRVTTRHPHVTIDKGTDDDPWPCARLRRDTVHLWILEIADHKGRWSTTLPVRRVMGPPGEVFRRVMGPPRFAG